MSPETLFSVQRRTADDGSPCLDLCGEVDAYTAPILRSAIADELRAGGGLVVECSHLDFIDGSGLRVLEWAAAAAWPETVEVQNAPPVMRQLAVITGLDRRIAFVTSRSLRPAPRARDRAC